jgi:hypothetical protein
MSPFVSLALLEPARAQVVVVHHPVVYGRPVRPVVVYTRPLVYPRVWAPPVAVIPMRTITYVRPPPVVTWEEDLEPAVRDAAPPAVVEAPERRGLERADTVAVGVVGGSFLST